MFRIFKIWSGGDHPWGQNHFGFRCACKGTRGFHCLCCPVSSYAISFATRTWMNPQQIGHIIVQIAYVVAILWSCKPRGFWPESLNWFSYWTDGLKNKNEIKTAGFPLWNCNWFCSFPPCIMMETRNANIFFIFQGILNPRV